VCRVRTARLFSFDEAKEIAMLTPNPASGEPATPQQISPPDLQQLAERLLRSNPYLALKNISCDCRYGVLVLRGSLPSFYLKQVAQEIVSRLEGVEAIDNQIQIVPPPPDQAEAEAAKGRAEE
jgi:hypothetical protein